MTKFTSEFLLIFNVIIMKLSILLFIGIISFAYSSEAQILKKIKEIKDDVAAVTIDKLSKDPITTSFSDVDKTRYLDDSFGNDVSYSSFFEQPFKEETGFLLQPGFYEGNFQSFCIKVGTVMPGRGNGRFYAPLRGPKADILETIINAYEKDSQITQREVQILLWAIIAKTDFYKMKGEAKILALKLLSEEQIARLSKGALSELTRNQLKRLAYKSKTTRDILLAENTLRGKYYKGYSSYKDFEDIAMVAGVEPVIQGFDKGRWTKHPDGFFIRYYTASYHGTKTQIYIPDELGVQNFNPRNAVAVPAGYGQRLLQTSLPTISGGPNTGGNSGGNSGIDDEPNDDAEDTSETSADTSNETVVLNSNTDPDPFCTPIIDSRADETIKTQMIMQNIPGVAVAVFQNGQMVHLQSYGYIDIFEKAPFTTATIVNWASISKSVTGVAAAQLQQNNANFKLEDRVTKYVDNWKNVRYMDTSDSKGGVDGRPELITIKQILNNSSGIQHYRKGRAETNYTTLNGKVIEFIENKGNYSSEIGVFDATKAVSVFNESVLDFKPGDNYLYSTYGFVLAGAVVEKVSPNGYVGWVMDKIADKAGLRSLRVRDPARPGHVMRKDGIMSVTGSGPAEYTLPAGGWESNICDLAKYASGLSNGKFFESNKDILWSNSVAMNTRSGMYSYGLNFTGTGENLTVWHGGHGGNARSYMQFFPSDDTGIAILAPAVYSNLPRMAQFIFQAMDIRPTMYNSLVHTPLDNCGRDRASDKDRFYGIWRKTNDDVIIRTGLKGETFFEEVTRLEESDYHCVKLVSFLNNGIQYWDGVFKKGVPKTKIVKNLDTAEFLNTYTLLINNGYSLTDVEGYSNENNLKNWAGIFQRNQRNQKVRMGINRQSFTIANTQNVNNGLNLIDIEVSTETNGTTNLITGVWAEGEETLFEMDMNQPSFRQLVRDRRNLGYRVLDVEYYWTNNNQDLKIAAIWGKSNQDDLVTGDGIGLLMFCDFMSQHETNSSRGYELINWNRMTD
ncbi:CubicO group peptidase (beta-lactamase class C family) [Ulvibacter sp. MAR_2010_11]|uniref:serine hydrolase n=1 Tax=Ulvibacter sp. MAR_2010_11 TaxID=1250229 RepID=UPI000C2C374B|nr:serine hydrolase [Ulvibacter sp. MAR_2010_11]PKA84609.1 CubicO group peptidase (beta-lactamase class C family) [Ulvibacter sp. MAR_2010_11]